MQDDVKKMKFDKAAGPSGVEAELLKAGGEECLKFVTQLMNAFIGEDYIPSEWDISYIINL